MSNDFSLKNTQQSFDYNDILYVNVKEKWEHGASYCENYTLFFVNSGKLRLWCTPGHIEINCGCALILAPGTRIRSGYSGNEGVEFFKASFCTSEPFFKISSPVPVCCQSVAHKLLDSLYRSRFAPEYSAHAKNALLYGALYHIYDTASPSTLRERDMLNDIFAYIEDNLTRDFDFDDLQKALGLDRSHISRVFSKAVGKTLKAYVNERRVALACDMLATSSFDINKIASLMGFEESNLFTKFFTYHTGITPSDYRRKVFGTKPLNG
ncbi:MAG: helix-turn-helix transcriptional regulator [Ruminococcaceae bacterium]|nr:helix-turn-helix transcriptional regulator [Oscillospiraceae bacterium]